MIDGSNLEALLHEQGEIMCSTSGTSMWPMLRHRQDMIVVGSESGDLKRHQVPLYRLPSGKLILHRILKVKSDYYVIRGDNLFRKERVPKDWVIGVLKAFYRDGKYYDCEKSRAYKAYVFLNRVSYPLRYAWKKALLPFLVKIKHVILPVKTN